MCIVNIYRKVIGIVKVFYQLSGNPSAPTLIILATIGNPLAPIGKIPTIGKSTIEAKGFSSRG